MADFEVFKGDAKNFVITVKQNGVAVDITGYTFFMTVKDDINNSDTNANIKKTVTNHTDPTAGITTIALTPTDTDIVISSSTKNYVYDVRMKDTSGNITTLLSGVFKVKQPITSDTS